MPPRLVRRKKLPQSWRFPGKLEPTAGCAGRRDIAVYRGAVEADNLNFIVKWMLKKVKALAGECRDWETTTAWATAIAEELRAESLAQGAETGGALLALHRE